MAEVMPSVLFVIPFGRLMQKQSADFTKTWCCHWAFQSEELVNFWWWSGPGFGLQITFPLPSPLQKTGF